jgi:ABC-type bacteriocin/lantibiotic exporter with double-glycine peptidase domain
LRWQLDHLIRSSVLLVAVALMLSCNPSASNDCASHGKPYQVTGTQLDKLTKQIAAERAACGSSNSKNDCGIVALRVILELKKQYQSYDTLTQLVSRDNSGSSMLALKKFLTSQRIESRGYALTDDSLCHQLTPDCCAIIRIKSRHFVLLFCSPMNEKALLFDPLVGAHSVALSRLRSDFGWDGAVLLVN